MSHINEVFNLPKIGGLEGPVNERKQVAMLDWADINRIVTLPEDDEYYAVTGVLLAFSDRSKHGEMLISIGGMEYTLDSATDLIFETGPR